MLEHRSDNRLTFRLDLDWVPIAIGVKVDQHLPHDLAPGPGSTTRSPPAARRTIAWSSASRTRITSARPGP
jgi:hypothetical protein